jgi:hypothetical protein
MSNVADYLQGAPKIWQLCRRIFNDPLSFKPAPSHPKKLYQLLDASVAGGVWSPERAPEQAGRGARPCLPRPERDQGPRAAGR